ALHAGLVREVKQIHQTRSHAGNAQNAKRHDSGAGRAAPYSSMTLADRASRSSSCFSTSPEAAAFSHFFARQGFAIHSSARISKTLNPITMADELQIFSSIVVPSLWPLRHGPRGD